MTAEEQSQFRKEFKSIVYQKGLISANGDFLRILHAYDKNDSHKNAILKHLDKRKELQNRFKEMLKGKTYEQWKQFSRRLSALNSRLKRGNSAKERAEVEIDKLTF